jgi:hypothetical protein
MKTLIGAAGQLLRRIIAFYRTPATSAPSATSQPSGPSLFGPDKQCTHPMLRPRRRRIRGAA